MRPALVAAVFLALVAPAHASTAQVALVDSCGSDVACGKYDAGHDVPVVVYIATPGEANRLVARRTGDEVMLSDPGATITVGDSCRSAGRHAAVCTAAPGDLSLPAFVAQLGDGGDALTIDGALGVRTSLYGGPADDTLTGGGDDDTIDGGRGADRLEGGAGGQDALSFASRDAGVTVDLAAVRTSDGDIVGDFERVQGGYGRDRLLGLPGADTLDGGPGDDVVRGRGGDDDVAGDLGADTVEGGSGDDRVSGDPPQGDDYYTRRIHLSPDVLRGGTGDDELRDSGGANRVEGGPGDDLLVGGAGPDRLFGGSGLDALYGHRGSDRLHGGSGNDDLRGGSGPDLVLARDRRRDRVACGSGRDTARIDAKDVVHACETRRPAVYTGQR